MSVRRRVLLSLAFLTAATLLADGSAARAQQRNPPSSPGTHERIAPSSLSPEEVKQALERLMGGGDLPPGLKDALRDRMLKDLMQKNPEIDPKLAEALMNQLLANPEMMKRLADQTKKMSNGGGKNLSPADLDRLAQNFKDLPPFPKMQPGDLPAPGKLPDLPKNLNPFDKQPRPLPGDMPPPKLINPEPPKVEPPPIPKLEKPGDNPFAKLDPSREGMDPFAPNETPREKAKRALGGLWENNIGPLEESPSVERALTDLIDGTADLKNSDGKSVWEDLLKDTGNSDSFKDLFDGTGGSDWNLNFDLPKLNWGSSNLDRGGGSDSSSGSGWWNRRGSSSSSPRSSGSGPGSINIGIPGLSGAWVLPVLVLVLLVTAFIAWRLWEWKHDRAAAAHDLGGLGGWPIDPRRIATREHVVIAFEYLSVLICGPSAKMWTHNTIAAALADLASTHAEIATLLARLYELARYAPLDEPLTTAELAEARRIVCRLAGLEYE